MESITIEQAQASLAAVIARLTPGEEVVIVQQDRPVARLMAEPTPRGKGRRPGSAIGTLRVVADDDAHLDDFREYMR